MRTWELFVIPEDGNLQDVVNGFHTGMSRMQNQRWTTYGVAKRKHHGWPGAVDAVGELNLPQFPKRHVLLVVDFDVDPDHPQVGYENDPAGARIRQIEHKLDEMGLMPYRDRIHIIGVCRQSEDLKTIGNDWGERVVPDNPQSFESMGRCLARKCSEKDFGVWDVSPVLNANGSELGRLQRTVCVNLTIPLADEDRILD